MADISTELGILADLVAIPSVPEMCNPEWLAYAQARLTGAGCRTTVVPSHDGTCLGLIASTGPESPGGVVLSGHVDVVSTEGQNWTSTPFALRRDGSRFFGRGTADMKGFVACAIAAIEEAAQKVLEHPVHLVLSADEESTCQSAVTLASHIAENVPTPRGVLVGEPTGLHAVNRHKGSFTYHVSVTGRSAHASMPELGASASIIAARLIAWLDDRSAQNSASGSTIHSIGRIKGGSASNIIAEHCRFEWDIRLAPDDNLDAWVAAFRTQAAQLIAPLQERVPEVAVRVEQTARFPGFQTLPDEPFAQECLAVSAASSHSEYFAGTEAGLFQEAGFQVIVMGPGDIAQAHTPDEFIQYDQLSKCRRQLRDLILR